MLPLTLILSGLLIPPQAAPTLASLEGLPPEAVGDIVLSGRDHGVIEEMEFPISAGPAPPGFVELHLVERASQQSGGCVRQRWKATFRRVPLDDPEGVAVLNSIHPSTEVALLSGDGCSEGKFVHANPGVTVERALGALTYLAGIRSGQIEVQFSCTDKTRSNLCQSPQMIRQELARLPAWVVTKRGAATELWLGRTGQFVTRVIFADPRSLEVRVEREVPAPF